MDSEVENITLANGTNSVTFAGTTAHTVTGGTGADTIAITAGTTAVTFSLDLGVDVASDRIFITNPGTDYVYNEAIVFRGPKKAQKTAKYTSSVSTYGLKSKKLDAPILNETSAANLALYAARKDADAVVLAEQIDFTAIGIGALATDMLETELNDLVQVKRLTYDGRNITINCVVEGLAHSITADNWRVSYFTSVVDPYTITI